MKKNILIADDCRGFLALMVKQLTEKGFNMQTSVNGNECIKNALLYKPDLILMDLVMPSLCGKKTIFKLKEYQETSRIPIIVLSGDAIEYDDLILNEIDDYFKKPIKIKELVTRIEELVYS